MTITAGLTTPSRSAASAIVASVAMVVRWSAAYARSMIATGVESARPSAMELANQLNIPYREGFVKNRYIGRTFIMPEMDQRHDSIDLKLAIVPSVVMLVLPPQVESAVFYAVPVPSVGS